MGKISKCRNNLIGETPRERKNSDETVREMRCKINGREALGNESSSSEGWRRPLRDEYETVFEERPPPTMMDDASRSLEKLKMPPE